MALSESPPLRRGDSLFLPPITVLSVKCGDVCAVLAEGLTFPALHYEITLAILISFIVFFWASAVSPNSSLLKNDKMLIKCYLHGKDVESIRP